MCTNFFPTTDVERLRKYFDANLPNAVFKEEVFTGFQAPVIRQIIRSVKQTGEQECIAARFGIIPYWSGVDEISKIGRVTYNARTETVASKPSYRSPWKRRQFCIIPTDAIFEINYENGFAERWRIERADGKPMGIAGIWEHWERPGEVPIDSFSMLTINADDHPLMSRFHRPDDEKRMVIILDEKDYDAWLQVTSTNAVTYFRQYPAERLIAKAVPRVVAKRTRPVAAAKAKSIIATNTNTQGKLFGM